MAARRSSTAAAAALPRPDDEEELAVADALRFLNRVKVEFGDRPHVYNEFEDILKKFNTQEVDTPGVIERVTRLFSGHFNLIDGFNMFLPDGYRISVGSNDVAEDSSHAPEAVQTIARQQLSQASASIDNLSHPVKKAPQEDVELLRAARYVKKVKERFPPGSDTYKKFLSLLNSCKSGKLGLKCGFEKLSMLFEDDLELLNGFIYFLPNKIQTHARGILKEIAAASSLEPASEAFGMCVICMDRPRSHTFVPCGHLSVCSLCASRAVRGSKSCPICSRQPSKAMRIYLP